VDTVEDFINQYEGEQQALLKYFHHYLYTQTGLIPRIKYKVPFYYNKSWICSLNPIKQPKKSLNKHPKSSSIELAFTRGNELSNNQAILQSKGRKQVMSITFSSIKEIPVNAVEEIIQEAILLDEQIPYASKRKKKKKGHLLFISNPLIFLNSLFTNLICKLWL